MVNKVNEGFYFLYKLWREYSKLMACLQGLEENPLGEHH